MKESQQEFLKESQLPCLAQHFLGFLPMMQMQALFHQERYSSMMKKKVSVFHHKKNFVENSE